MVKTSATLASIFPVYVNKNNQGGVLKIGADTKTKRFVQDEMLLKNVDL